MKSGSIRAACAFSLSATLANMRACAIAWSRSIVIVSRASSKSSIATSVGIGDDVTHFLAYERCARISAIRSDVVIFVLARPSGAYVRKKWPSKDERQQVLLHQSTGRRE